MQKKEFIILPNTKDLKVYEEYNFNSFVLPLKDYSIGFNVYYTIEEINDISTKHNVYVIINKFLHMSIYDFKSIFKSFNDNIMFIVEDIGLTNIIPKNRLILYENHILSNKSAINYLGSLNISNVVINNDLTINELKCIQSECKSNMFYFYIAKNMLMYSRRALVSNFNKNFEINDEINNYLLNEHVSKKVLEINEEDSGSIVRYNKIFCASKYLDDLKGFNLIIDLTNINEVSTKMILENINEKNLCNLIDSDYYFLENDVKYKVGDLK